MAPHRVSTPQHNNNKKNAEFVQQHMSNSHAIQTQHSENFLFARAGGTSDKLIASVNAFTVFPATTIQVEPELIAYWSSRESLFVVFLFMFVFVPCVFYFVFPQSHPMCGRGGQF